MTSSGQSRRLALTEFVGEKWQRFWFTPEPLYALGLVRMAFGALMVYVTLDLLPAGLITLFGQNGPVPVQPTAENFHWVNTLQFGLFQIWTSDTAILVLWAVLLLSAIALTVGWHSRLAAVVVWVVFLSFVRRNPAIFNAGDQVMLNTALILAIASCGAALSLDQRRRTGRFWSAETRSHWPVRLLQVQLSLIYFFTGQIKLIGPTWNDGTAVSYPWRMYHDWAILPAPQWLSEQPFLVNVATWGTLVIELALGILVWNRRLRYWVLGAGVFLHVAIWLSLSVAFFSLAMFVLYLSWVPWETARDLPTRINGVLRRRFNQQSTPPDNVPEEVSQSGRTKPGNVTTEGP